METFASPNVNVAVHCRAGVALNGAFRCGLLRVGAGCTAGKHDCRQK